ncbi:I78 family peptidase inhibitor [Alteraurantiacibacter buctensis]|uniref:Peptidase inhibitor I78 n=1 Tax=Alteraurantiacibacter buctensis TaxID=1503981 RepID=A0A844Z2E8_9SPHN|nr:I78 family peptidase inhibitor [Alteraurantiacibacter buctensis]MXO73161.1 hypothetical protein [Alteraurantiacibacter buctensis]
MRSIAVLPALALLLGACTTTGEEPPQRELAGECDASGVQEHIGHRATAESGATLLRLTGARTLRWVPPRTAVTMDFRADRLTVSYDDDMVIERISCG